MTDRRAILGTALPLACAALALCGPALWNRYPLVYNDTGAYLRAGLDLKVPGDRSIHYGLFLRAVALTGTLWPAVLIQGLCVAGLVLIAFRRTTAARPASLAALVATGFLTHRCRRPHEIPHPRYLHRSHGAGARAATGL